MRLTGGPVKTEQLTSTDGEGRYEFANFPAGRYTITVSKAGYVTLNFGQRRPFETGRPLDIADGQVVEQIDFALPRGSVITGRITDSAGDPLAGAWVSVMRYQYLPGGRRQLMPVEPPHWLAGVTNDLGEFRVFGLMPGSYIVSARASTTGPVGLSSPRQQMGGVESITARDGYLQTYFPGTANVAEAQPVVVDLSEEAQASFALVTGRVSQISGAVRRSDGMPPAGWHVHLRPNDAFTTVQWANSVLGADGGFRFANVPPGEHVLEVLPPGQAIFFDNVMARLPNDNAVHEFARMPLTVGGDIAGLVVTTRPGISVSGHVVFPNGSVPKGGDSRPRINATAANPEDTWRDGMSYGTGHLDATGRFQIRDVMGRVLFRPASLPAGLVLKSVRLNGADITDRPYDSANGDLTGVEIVIVRGAQLSGTARNSRGEAVSHFKAALFPAGEPPGLHTSRYMHTATANQNGRVQIEGLAPGEYLGVALESLDQGQEWDPALQKRVLPLAKRFSLREGETAAIELPYLD